MAKKYDFNRIGMVHPRVYNWKKQFHDLIVHCENRSKLFVVMDVGKVAGLCHRLQEVEDLVLNNQKILQKIKRLKSKHSQFLGG